MQADTMQTIRFLEEFLSWNVTSEELTQLGNAVGWTRQFDPYRVTEEEYGAHIHEFATHIARQNLVGSSLLSLVEINELLETRIPIELLPFLREAKRNKSGNFTLTDLLLG